MHLNFLSSSELKFTTIRLLKLNVEGSCCFHLLLFVLSYCWFNVDSLSYLITIPSLTSFCFMQISLVVSKYMFFEFKIKSKFFWIWNNKCTTNAKYILLSLNDILVTVCFCLDAYFFEPRNWIDATNTWRTYYVL